MAIMRWDPFRELDTLQDRMNRMFDESLFRLRPTRGEALWSPSVDIYEDNNHIVVRAELPDMNEKDVDVSIENNMLTLKGEKKLEREEKKDNYHLIESSWGSFSRSFNLPSTVDADKAEAKFEKGVLRISLPKKEEAKPKQIKVKVS
jgi:HSP20 family protein